MEMLPREPRAYEHTAKFLINASSAYTQVPDYNKY